MVFGGFVGIMEREWKLLYHRLGFRIRVEFRAQRFKVTI